MSTEKTATKEAPETTTAPEPKNKKKRTTLKPKLYLVAACYDYGVPNSQPTPKGFKWEQHFSFTVESKTFPNKQFLLEEALTHGAKANGLEILAISPVPANWAKVEVEEAIETHTDQ